MDIELAKRYFLIGFVVFFSLIAILFGVYLLLFTPTLYLKLLSALFLLLAVIAFFFNTMGSIYFYKSYLYRNYKITPLERFPSVAVVVASYNEEPETVEQTINSLKALDYPREKISYYLLDDSTKPEIVRELSAFCKKEGVALQHRDNRRGFKGGALNEFLKGAKEEFIAIFDADEMLAEPSFLRETLCQFREGDIAYVQTSKRYARGSLFANTVDSTHAFFSNFVQPSRAHQENALFAGSCGVLRTSIVKKLGGFDDCVVEDAAFSLKADISGYRGVYIPKVYALGAPIENFTGFAAQQWRYNFGNTQLIGKYLANFTKLPARKHMDYITLIFGLHYLSAVFIIFALLTVLMAFADVSTAQMMVEKLLVPLSIKFQLEILSALSIVTMLLAALIIAKVYFNSFTIGFIAYFLNFGVAFVRAKAAVAALLNSRADFLVIKRNGTRGMPFLKALRLSAVETTFAVLLLAAAAVLFVNSDISSAFWISWYGLLFSSPLFFAYFTG